MSELQRRLEQAANHFRDCFLESSLFTSGELERQGFSLLRESSGGGLRGSVKEGNFYGGSDITLIRTDGSLLQWTVRMLHESGDDWQHFGAYSYVSAYAEGERALIPLYTVAYDGLPNPQSEKAFSAGVDWFAFCEEMTMLSEECLSDMEFIFRHNLTGQLYEMSGQYPDASQPNPFVGMGVSA